MRSKVGTARSAQHAKQALSGCSPALEELPGEQVDQFLSQGSTVQTGSGPYGANITEAIFCRPALLLSFSENRFRIESNLINTNLKGPTKLVRLNESSSYPEQATMAVLIISVSTPQNAT